MRRQIGWALAGIAALFAYRAASRRKVAVAAHDDDLINQAIDDSFPASDPPSFTPAAASASHDRE